MISFKTKEIKDFDKHLILAIESYASMEDVRTHSKSAYIVADFLKEVREAVGVEGFKKAGNLGVLLSGCFLLNSITSEFWPLVKDYKDEQLPEVKQVLMTFKDSQLKDFIDHCNKTALNDSPNY
jgi:hypothetical protein